MYLNQTYVFIYKLFRGTQALMTTLLSMELVEGFHLTEMLQQCLVPLAFLGDMLLTD